MSGKASWTGLIGCVVGALLWLTAASSAHAAPSWLPAFDLAFPVDHVVMAADGTTVYYGRPFVGGAYRAAAQVRPPGGPLGPVQYVSADGDSIQGVSMATGGDGRTVAAWVTNGVVQTAVMPAGATGFGPARAMPTTAGETPTGALAVAVDGAGDALVLWSASGASTTFLRVGVQPASGATPTTQLMDSAGFGPNEYVSMQSLGVAAAADGSAMVAWLYNDSNSNSEQTTTIAKAALRKPGSPFGSPTTLESGFDPGGGTYPKTTISNTSAAMTPSGHAAVIWEKSFIASSGAQQTWSISFKEGDASAGLGSTVDATPGFGGAPLSPKLVLGPDGRVAIGARANVSSVVRPQVSLRPPGGVFGIVQTLASTGPGAGSLDLASGASGELVAAWETNAGTPNSTTISGAAAAPGEAFGPAATLASNLGSVSGPTVAVGPEGDGVAGWSTTAAGGAAGFDASPPAFPAPAFPAAATVGTPAAFSVGAPTDVWGPIASITWDFGDGSSADGANVSHAYAAAGSPTAKLVVTDAAGNAASASSPVTVALAADTVAPTISAASLSRRVFAVAAAPTALTAAHRRGTVIRFTLSEAAAVRIAIRRASPGRRSGARCVKPTAKLRRARRCTRFLLIGTLRRSGAAGANAVPFSGRLGNRALKPGAYQAVIAASDAAGNAAKPTALPFRVVRR